MLEGHASGLGHEVAGGERGDDLRHGPLLAGIQLAVVLEQFLVRQSGTVRGGGLLRALPSSIYSFAVLKPVRANFQPLRQRPDLVV